MNTKLLIMCLVLVAATTMVSGRAIKIKRDFGFEICQVRCNGDYSSISDLPQGDSCNASPGETTVSQYCACHC